MKNDDKTEKPTARRRRESERQGSIARSADVGSLFGILSVLVVVVFVLPTTTEMVGSRTASMLRASAQGPMAPGLGDLVLELVVVSIGPVLAITFVAAVAAGLVQTRGKVAPKTLQPKLTNLSPKKGLQRLSPKQMGWDLVRTLAKIALLAIAALAPVTSLLGSFETLRSLGEWMDYGRSLINSVLVRSLLLAGVIAAADFAWSKRKTEKGMKMSKQDVKDEARSQEGDPSIRGRRRSKMREMSRNRAIAAVGTADVVLLNPVRFAVALRYQEGDPAPRVVAKGAGALARRIRAEAYRHGVPVRQDPPLARALFRRCEVGHYVPAALFEAVAVVLAAVYRRRWRTTPVPVGAHAGASTGERS